MIQENAIEIDGWVLRSFGSCAELIRDPITPDDAKKFPYIGLEHIEEGTLRLSNYGLGEDVTSLKTRFKKGDILFGKLRPYFRKVVVAPFDGICSTDIWVVRPKPGIDPKFLYYWMASQQFVDDNSRAAEGTKMPRAKWDYAEQLERYVPPRTEQKAIGEALGSLDNKIEQNRRMNITLEKIAQTLFKSWFVDFEPVRERIEGRRSEGIDDKTAELFPCEYDVLDGCKLPKGWTIKSLDQIASYLNGLALQNYPPVGGEYLPIIKIAQLRTESFQRADMASSKINQEYIIEDGDIIFSWSGSLEIIIWCGGQGALNQHLFKVTSADYPKWFYYFWTKEHLIDFQAIAAGKATTMGHIQRHHLTEAKVFVPNTDLLIALDRIMSPIINQIIQNKIQSRILSNIRETLLPKLLSGEIQMSDSGSETEVPA